MDVSSFLEGFKKEEVSPEEFGEMKASFETHMEATLCETAKFFAYELCSSSFDPRFIAAFEIDVPSLVVKSLRKVAEEIESGAIEA
jgi:hypothetical protein